MTLIGVFIHVAEDGGRGRPGRGREQRRAPSHPPPGSDLSVTSRAWTRHTASVAVGRDLPPTMSFFQPHAPKVAQKQAVDPQHQPWVEK